MKTNTLRYIEKKHEEERAYHKVETTKRVCKSVTQIRNCREMTPTVTTAKS